MDPEVVLMPQAHLSNVAEPRGHAALQEDILIRQTRFSYLEGLSACGVFGASHQPCSGGAQMDIGEQKGPA